MIMCIQYLYFLCIVLYYYNIICVIIVLFAGCSVIVDRHDILPCAAPFKILQGVAVPFSFFSFKWHCKLLIITLLERTATSRSSTEIPTRSNPVPSHPSEYPSSSSGTHSPPILLSGTLVNPKKDLLLGKSSRRTLFLSDSILSRVNANSLKTDINETCVKKTMYYFSDFSNFEPEFGYCDKIVISAGINDLTRKRLTPEQICDVVLPQLR